MPSNPGGTGSDAADVDADGESLPGPTYLGDDGTPRCGVPNTSADGNCSVPVPNGVCHVHGDLDDRRRAAEDGEYAIADGHGSGDPGHSKGGGAAPEGNKNAMTHGGNVIQRDPWGVFDYLEEHEPQAHRQVLVRFWGWLHRADFPAYVYQQDAGPTDAARNALADLGNNPEDVELPPIRTDVLSGPAAELFLAVLKGVMSERHSSKQLDDGLTKTEKRISDTGDEYYVEVEDPANLPTDRLERQKLRTLKELGLLDDPESQKADALGDWGAAAQHIAQREDTRDA